MVGEVRRSRGGDRRRRSRQHAGQIVGNVIGIQDGFSWKSLAVAGAHRWK